ncbi:hypothetical protein ID866_8655 [Astraeus odoratus]|nr:hypothetical protein ID866_8655 [Astraeus odoratus]
MDTSNKNIESVNWKEVWEAEEVKKHQEVEEAKKRECKAVEVQHQEEAAEAERQQEAERAKVTEIGSAWGLLLQRGGEKKKRSRKVWMVNDDDDDDDDDDIVVVSTHKAGKSESGTWEMLAQVVDRQMGEVVEELQGMRKRMAMMAESNWDLTLVLYHGFQSVDTLVDEVQIFGAKGFLPKPTSESKPAEDELQEALRKVEGLEEEHLEWAMEKLQMQKGWMQKEEEALSRHLKGKSKEPVKEKEQDGNQGTRDEEEEEAE